MTANSSSRPPRRRFASPIAYSSSSRERASSISVTAASAGMAVRFISGGRWAEPRSLVTIGGIVSKTFTFVSQLESKRHRDRVEGGFCRAVDRHAGERGEAEARRHVDDRGERLSQQVRQEEIRQVDRGEEIDRDLFLGALQVLGVPEVDEVLDAGIVHEDVHPREVPLDETEEVLTVARVGDVRDPRVQRRMHRLRFLQPFPAPSADDHLVAALEELARQLEADAGRAAGDEHGVIRQFHRIALYP